MKITIAKDNLLPCLAMVLFIFFKIQKHLSKLKKALKNILVKHMHRKRRIVYKNRLLSQ